MLILDGYLIKYDQLSQIGTRRGLLIENGNASILNRDLRNKGVKSIYAWPVDYPRRTPERPGVPVILIATRRRDEHLIHLADCKTTKEDEFDLTVKRWLGGYGINNPPFVAVPDPNGEYNEYGVDCD